MRAPDSRRSARGRRRSSTAPAAPQPVLTWLTRDRGIDIAVLTAMTALALAPLADAYQSASFFIACGVGLLAGVTIGVVGAARRWPTISVIAATLVAIFALGAVAAPTTAIGGIVPTPETWQLMGVGFVTVWKQVLTIAPPLGGAGVLLLLPFLLALLGSMLALVLALRTARFWTALLLPVLVCTASILFGTRESVGPLLLGVGGILLAMFWVAHRAGRLETRRVIALPIVAGLVVIGGTAANLVLQPENVRYVLRDQIEPPPDPRDFASPLASFRKYVDARADDVLFRIDGEIPDLAGTLGEHPEGGIALRLAAMDYYDGRVWNIAEVSTVATGAFSRTGERITSDPVERTPELRIEVEDYHDVWVPGIGGSVEVTFGGTRAKDLTRSFYYNRVSATGLVTAGLQGGDSADVHFTVADTPADVDRAGLQAESLSLPEPVQVPESVADLAKKYAEGASGDYQRVEALAQSLASYGYFSDGLVGEQPSRPGHGAGRLATMIEDPEAIIGDEEQYAALMALMVRALGLPARVVMGFHLPPGETAVTGEDVTAWVEVAFEGAGWLPFYPTPPEDQKPQTQDPEPQDRPQPQVIQPPDPPQPEAEVPPQERDEIDPDSEETDDEEDRPAWVRYSALLGLPLLVLLAPIAIILALKDRRRRHRRTRGTASNRLAGGWLELSDQALDLGLVAPPGLTRSEASAVLAREFGVSTTLLAQRADAGVFAPEEPAEREILAFWEEVTQTRGSLRRARTLRRRFRAAISLRSLRAHRRRARLRRARGPRTARGRRP
ncbi:MULTISPECIES: transglutaminase family protein [unclassified Pseudactinotalea]|uniref:transglutaminase-like domain-containing protein n=1 Tax=unclassified Pseudactinotalea TaxID=2649176 RepID=UPI00128B630F|nr:MULTISPECIES: transglutaminase-like domain-containing protein [unclassified Pseudactinotalea]MPV49775.1 hypothetical protein [Pseudactinotalea sp. HY160]QGH69542.1 hypothetical protein GCE65_08470 [Pseudactinotalea sp. HY158]